MEHGHAIYSHKQEEKDPHSFHKDCLDHWLNHQKYQVSHLEDLSCILCQKKIENITELTGDKIPEVAKKIAVQKLRAIIENEALLDEDAAETTAAIVRELNSKTHAYAQSHYKTELMRNVAEKSLRREIIQHFYRNLGTEENFPALLQAELKNDYTAMQPLYKTTLDDIERDPNILAENVRSELMHRIGSLWPDQRITAYKVNSIIEEKMDTAQRLGIYRNRIRGALCKGLPVLCVGVVMYWLFAPSTASSSI
jgi:hypothetical protein